jgi:hypothetical protein
MPIEVYSEAEVGPLIVRPNVRHERYLGLEYEPNIEFWEINVWLGAKGNPLS